MALSVYKPHKMGRRWYNSRSANPRRKPMGVWIYIFAAALARMLYLLNQMDQQ